MTSRWTHINRTAQNRKGRFHRVDPTYNGNKRPAWWSCHSCGGEILLDGAEPPTSTSMPVKKTAPKSEPVLSAQP